MLLSLFPTLEDLIVEVLALTPGLAAEEIQKRVNARGSPQRGIHALYKQLRGLGRKGVIVREGKLHFLRPHWVAELLSFSDRLETHTLNQSVATRFLPPPGSKVQWRFNSLLRLNDFASSVLFNMCEVSKALDTFSWHPHSWFWLVQPQKEAWHWERMKKRGVHRYIIVKGQTPLDHWIASKWSHGMVTARLGKDLPHASRQRYFVVCRPFILWIHLDAWSAQAIEDLFVKSGRNGKIEASTFTHAFNSRKGKQRVLVENNAEKCTVLEKYFIGVFGVSPRNS